ncbi:Chromosomal protein MC1c [uncultured archaeon]|nr:Chromosomal protein MC1c [uncultured archaeon]
MVFSRGIKYGRKKKFRIARQGWNEIGVFCGKQPRQAALKAANRGITDIMLRERGTKKVHIFQGERRLVPKPANAPGWMPGNIWKPNVKKVGIEKL